MSVRSQDMGKKSTRQRLLFVAHADQEGEIIHIISSRKATTREEEAYAKIR